MLALQLYSISGSAAGRLANELNRHGVIFKRVNEKGDNMANFVNNEPKFKVGDKVVYSRRHDDQAGWEIKSIGKGPLTISKVNKFYNNNKLININYWVEELAYVYSEDWLSYAPAGPKFKIGDFVHNNTFMMAGVISDIVTKTYASDGRQEYQYKIKIGSTENLIVFENSLAPATSEEILIHDLETCGGEFGCTGCSRENPDGTGTGCDKLELDAAELIKKLQKRVKELEEEKK